MAQLWEDGDPRFQEELARTVSGLSGQETEDTLTTLRSRLQSEESAKTQGAVHTPWNLAGHVVGEAIDQWNRIHRGGGHPQIAGDLSCGTGVFLQHLLASTGGQVVGVDIDPVATALSTALSAQGGDRLQVLRADSLLQAGSSDSLFSTHVEGIPEKFDLLVGNPPYVRNQSLTAEYKRRLRSLFPNLCKGNFDLSVLFLEHALRSLSPGGVCSYILTSKFMAASYGKAICTRLSESSRILRITDFQDNQVFPGRTTYSSF